MKNRSFEARLAAVAVGALCLTSGCTAAQGRLDAQILTGACEVGSILLVAPNAEPLCADISLVEQLIESWSAPTNAAMHANRPMTQTDLYYMAKAAGAKPAKVTK